MRKGTKAESKSAAMPRGWRYKKELAKTEKQPVIWQKNQEKGMISYVKYC